MISRNAAFRDGKEAGWNGHPISANPHPQGILHKEWEKGWRKAEFDRKPDREKLWVCTRSKCQTKSRYGDLKSRDDGGGRSTIVCPGCGHDTFYLRPLPPSNNTTHDPDRTTTS